MAEPTQPAWDSANTSAGHLSVHVEGAHPVDVPFLFEQQQKRLGGAFAAAFVYHLAMVALLLIAMRYGSPSTSAAILPPPTVNPNIVWLSEPGPGGGGGGGGNKMKEPPRQAKLPGKDKITVPVAPAPVLEAPKPEPPKIEPPIVEQQLNIPAKNMASALEPLSGAIDAPPGPPAPPTASRGSGSGTGAGTGTGSGIGAGTGSGLGEGSGGGTGGGVFRPGNGVTLPKVIREVKPQYTSDAMRAKVQGTVLLECVVAPDGNVSEVHVVRSLDPTFGLDQEAVKAARQWRFLPGTRMGEPVAVLVTIELTFTLR